MRPRVAAFFHEDDALLLGIGDLRHVTLKGPGGSLTLPARVGRQAPVGAVLVIADMPEAPVNRLLDASGSGRVSVTVVSEREEATA
jgi:hypothetical protein